MSPLNWRRAVIKVGSSLIAPHGNRCSAHYLLPIARFITAARHEGKEIIVVSSGSVAAGRSSVKISHTASIAEKQAMAAIGQMQMMANWQRFFDFPCAQVLLTADDLHDRTRYVNIKNTLRELLTHQALPIVNENDTVATDELKFGDNDNLGAYTALVAEADTLIICSDVDGLFTADPRKSPDAALIPTVNDITDQITALAGGAGTNVGTGGMRTKLEAAHKCMNSGIQTLIVNGTNPAVFDKLLQGENAGTHFTPVQHTHKARQLWLAHTLKSRGKIHIDEGAKKALVERGSSLLPSGIVEVGGHFFAGDSVEVFFNNARIAKGLSLYDARDLKKIMGLKSDQILTTLGYVTGEVVIHRDDLVLTE